MRDAGARPFYFIDMFYEGGEPGAVRDENLPHRQHTPSLFLVSPPFLFSRGERGEHFLSLAASRHGK